MFKVVPLTLELIGITSNNIKFMLDKVQQVCQPCRRSLRRSWLDCSSSWHQRPMIVNVRHSEIVGVSTRIDLGLVN